MATRVELNERLVDILGSENVYYQPPENLKMKFPCIRYEDEQPNLLRADNKIYRHYKCYNLVYITRKADDPMPDKILYSFDHISTDRPYKAENLYHYQFTLYY